MNLTKFGWRHAVASLFPPSHVLEGLSVHRRVEESSLSADSIILSELEKSKPTLIGRFGGTEARAYGCYLDIFRIRHLYDPFATTYSLLSLKRRIAKLRDTAGIYPANFQTYKDFINEYSDAIANTDVLGCWGETFTWVEREALKKSQAKVVPHHAVAPWVDNYDRDAFSPAPWSSFLSGKTVLIISPFTDSYSRQFSNLPKIFGDCKYPKFEPKFLKSTQSIFGLNDQKKWKWHLEEMKYAMRKIEFDVALVSAGGYAYPLANEAKKMGKVGIHAGGELQLFLGVLGGRWENSPKVLKYQSKYWIRPSNLEKPDQYLRVENGAYW